MSKFAVGIPKVHFKDDKGKEFTVVETKEYYDYDNRKVLEYTLDDGRKVAFIANRGV